MKSATPEYYIIHDWYKTKDCFWNCENVTVYDSYISGEYLAWNTKNLTFINCTIESDQGLDYIEGLKLVNCKMVNTKFAFEYAYDVDAEITTKIDSILNPGSGKIVAKEICELVVEPDNCDISKTEIVETDPGRENASREDASREDASRENASREDASVSENPENGKGKNECHLQCVKKNSHSA